MKNLLRFNFDMARAGLFALGPSLLFAFSANAYTENYQGTPKPLEPSVENLADDAAKNRGAEENSLIPHFQFFEYMQTMPSDGGRASSCCHMTDGVTNVTLERTDNKDFPLRMQLTHTRYGLKLEEPIWIDIPQEKILTAEHAERICAPFIEKSEAAGIEHTCTPPSFSAVWIYDRTFLEDGVYKINHDKPVDDNYVVPLSEYVKPEELIVYCVWDAPEF